MLYEDKERIRGFILVWVEFDSSILQTQLVDSNSHIKLRFVIRIQNIAIIRDSNLNLKN